MLLTFGELMFSESTSVLSGVRSRAAGLLSEVGCLSSIELIPIGLGGNNRVYRVEAGSHSYVLKEYFRHHGDTRDRLKAEFAFAQFAWSNGIRCIPKPITFDIAEGIGLFSLIEGERITPEMLSFADIKQAMGFITSLNHCRETPEARELPMGSEACFSISQHMKMINSRLERVTDIVPLSPIDHKALEFVHAKLVPAHRLVIERLCDSLATEKIAFEIDLLPEQRVISPSDFGFHNALRRQDGTIAFLDFEYAGWDDPAKLTGDFFNQVAVPVPLTYKDEVVKVIADILPDSGATIRLMLLLLPLYRIKWCCIVLNHFLPVDSGRRDFAQGVASLERKTEQLDKADLLLASIEQLYI